MVDKLVKLGFCGLRLFPSSIGDQLSVWRGDLSLGTLNYVRRAYKTWKKDTAAARATVPRKKKVPGKMNVKNVHVAKE